MATPLLCKPSSNFCLDFRRRVSGRQPMTLVFPEAAPFPDLVGLKDVLDIGVGGYQFPQDTSPRPGAPEDERDLHGRKEGRPLSKAAPESYGIVNLPK